MILWSHLGCKIRNGISISKLFLENLGDKRLPKLQKTETQNRELDKSNICSANGKKLGASNASRLRAEEATMLVWL
jgi:hypothetical protein